MIEDTDMASTAPLIWTFPDSSINTYLYLYAIFIYRCIFGQYFNVLYIYVYIHSIRYKSYMTCYNVHSA